MSAQAEQFLNYSVRWIGNILHDVANQQRANRVKRRKLRALRAEVRRLRVACKAADGVFNALDEFQWSRSEMGGPGLPECPVQYGAAHATVRNCLCVRNYSK